MSSNIIIMEKHTKILFSASIVYILANHQCFCNSTGPENLDDPIELLYRELSTDTFFSLPFHDPGDTAESFRRQYPNVKEDYQWADLHKNHHQPSLDGPPTLVDTDFQKKDQHKKSLKTLNPDAITIFHLCYSVSYIWRRGRKGIHRYYPMRDTYYNHLPFEVGYITQTIMAKYQNVLELYEFSVRMEREQKVGRPHLFFFYKNIMEECRTIIHLCNMMHEITRKYRVQQYSHRYYGWRPISYDPSAKFQDYVPRPPFNKTHPGVTERGIEGHEHEKFRHEDPAIFDRIHKVRGLLQKEKERQHEIMKPQKNYYIDHARFSATAPTTRRTKRWRPNEPLLYGWEPEDK